MLCLASAASGSHEGNKVAGSGSCQKRTTRQVKEPHGVTSGHRAAAAVLHLMFIAQDVSLFAQLLVLAWVRASVLRRPQFWPQLEGGPASRRASAGTDSIGIGTALAVQNAVSLERIRRRKKV